MEDKIVLRLIQISDLHISGHRDLLEPMIEPINNEDVDLVVVTGDIVHSPTKELLNKAVADLNKIKHRIIVLPGDYDFCDLWLEHFGDRYKTINLNGYHLDFIDTSFLGHRYFDGWGDVLAKEDSEQYDWLMNNLKTNPNYHIMFSHHPFWGHPPKEEYKNELVRDNLRAVYCGHLHETSKIYFKYGKPLKHFDQGFMTVPLRFHGNACYLITLVKDNGEIVNVPKVISAKRTVW